MPDPLKKPEGISWDPAAVQLPEMPMLPPGQDAMSATIAGVLPTLAAPLTANVAALNAKENMFSGKLVAAQSAYQNADDSGQQSVGQVTGMLGQLGQMGGQAAGSAGQAGGGGGGGGIFGSLMQQAMQATQGMGSQSGGSPAAGAPAGGGQPAMSQPGTAASGQAAPQAPASQHQEQPAPQPEHTTDQQAQDREPPLIEATGPGDTPPGAGPAPVDPPDRPGGSDEDLARRM